jgi:CheY-like chemotaxis protein
VSHVLIVCSNPDQAEIPAVVCHDARLTCAFATEFDAETRLAEELPDLVLMVVADPLAMTRRFHSASPRTPLVAITDGLNERDQRALRAAGISTIIFKPYSIQALRRALVGTFQQAHDGQMSWNRPAL